MESFNQSQAMMLEGSRPTQVDRSSLTDSHDVFFTGKRGYFFFPPEIRNEIMRYILLPGDIYLKSHPILGAAGSNYHRKKYGCQFLATCSQAYREGHELYYSFNTFHLPPGPDSWIVQVFQSVQLKHRGMIQYLALNCSIYDLYFLDMIQEIGNCADCILRFTHPGHIGTLTIALSYSQAAGITLWELWLRKLDRMLQNFPGLKKLSVTFMDGDNPWLRQYFGLIPMPGNLADQDQEDKPNGPQAVDQDDKVYPMDTIHLSTDEIYLWLYEEAMKQGSFPDTYPPFSEAAYSTRERVENLIYWEIRQMDHEGGNGHRYPERRLLSSWAKDRMNGRMWPSRRTRRLGI